MIKSGKNSITGWKGALFTIAGIIIPLILFLLYV